MKRGDDNESSLRTRLGEFHAQTTPVLKYYADKVATINADQDMDVITGSIRKALDE